MKYLQLNLSLRYIFDQHAHATYRSTSCHLIVTDIEGNIDYPAESDNVNDTLIRHHTDVTQYICMLAHPLPLLMISMSNLTKDKKKCACQERLKVPIPCFTAAQPHGSPKGLKSPAVGDPNDLDPHACPYIYK